MYIKKQMTGLEPNTGYLAKIEVEFSTSAPASAIISSREARTETSGVRSATLYVDGAAVGVATVERE